MKATHWEFKNRALVFGLIFAFGFLLYPFDHHNSTAALATGLGTWLGKDSDLLARLLFACAASLLVLAAFIRTWASSYLRAKVVYASEVKTESLVADGPYRRVRNPLYFANVWMSVALGSMMSRSGAVVAIVATLVFCYRLILREESGLEATQGEQYERYRAAVSRLWPSLRPRIAASGRRARWAEGFKAELWCWGIAAAVVAFAITLNIKVFFGILATSVGSLWFSPVVTHKKSNSQT